MCPRFPRGKCCSCLVDLVVSPYVYCNGFSAFPLCLYRLLHLAIIHEAKDYIRTMIDVSRNTDFLNAQNDQRQVRQRTKNHHFLCTMSVITYRITHSSSSNFFPSQTALHLAVITNQADVCQRLLVSGCDPTLVDDGGDTALHIACRHGNLPCFSVITQTCEPEHLHTMMAACNYHGKIILFFLSFLSLKWW